VFELSDAAAGFRGMIFVDQNTLVETSAQNGSILAPYRTVTQAVAAINAGASTKTEVFIALGDYSAEPPLSLLPGRLYVFTGSVRGQPFAALPPILWTVAGDLSSILAFRRCTVSLLTILDDAIPAIEAVLSYEDCECRGINGATTLSPVTILMAGTIGAFDAEINHITVTAAVRVAAINVQFGLFYCNNVAFQDSCPLVVVHDMLASNCSFEQNVQIRGTGLEMRSCIWRSPANLLTFTGLFSNAFLDLRTQNAFNTGQVSLVNGQYIATDQVYDPSSTIPIPEGSTTGQTTFSTQTTLSGASYRVPTFELASQVNIVATLVSAPTTFVVALYQGRGGQTTSPVTLVGQGTLLLTAPGSFSVPLTALTRIVPGVLFILFGKLPAGGNITVRTYTTPTQDLMNDVVSTPANAHPTAFTTVLPCAAPPASFDPRVSGGVVTPAGASNLTLQTRLGAP
jgi:hypothetical protein